MNDCRLKPRLLRSVVRDRLPDDKRPFPSPSDLATVLSHVRDHGLLSERHSDAADHKLVEAWRAAVDSWAERVVLLASSKEPDKCWAGTCLLGLTCEECCSDRFQSSYAIWFQGLLENLQSPPGAHIVKVACCASLADLFTRLSCFPNLKKDGTLFSGKLILPVLQLLNEDAGETAWEVALNLLCTLLSFFPSSAQRHYDNVEAVLTSKIMAGKFSLNTSKMFAKSLALLTKVKGDEGGWCSFVQKILIVINAILTDAFQDFEEGKKSFEVMKKVVPICKEPPPPLGGQMALLEASVPATQRIRELLVPRVTTLMDCLCIMFSNPHPLPVLIPVLSLLATVWRVLQVDGSFHGSFTTSLHQELLCAVLPSLHLSSLDLLTAIIKSLRSQLLPHGVTVVRFLTEYFQKAKLPAIRSKIYFITQMLLISMGAGMSIYLAQEVVSNAFTDLSDYLWHGRSPMQSDNQPTLVVCETVRQNYRRKRKRASEISLEFPVGQDISSKTANKSPQAPLSLHIAALKALEALLTVGGSLGSERWRPDVDCLVINVATSACDMGWANEDKMPGDKSSSFADFQLAALEVLLISLLSKTRGRPPYLSQGLDLFRRGRQETGTKVAAFSVKALVALEVLIHPRALPMEDRSPPQSPSFHGGFYEKIEGIPLNNITKSRLPFFAKGDLELLDEDEELSGSWFRKNDEQTPAERRDLNDKHTETAKRLSKCEVITKNPSTANAEANPGLECDNNLSQNVDAEMEFMGGDENRIDGEKGGESWSRNDDKLDLGGRNSAISAAKISHGETDGPFDATSLRNHVDHAPSFTVGEDAAPERASGFTKVTFAELPNDSDLSSMDSLPDIVDADPDSDSSI